MPARYGYGQTKVRNSPAPSKKWMAAAMDGAMANRKKNKKKNGKKKSTEKPSEWWKYSEKEIEEMGPKYPVGSEGTILRWVEDAEKRKQKEKMYPPPKKKKKK